MNINRQPAGQPTGGQFVEGARASASVGLISVPEDQLYSLSDLKFIPGGANIQGIEVLPRIDGKPGSTLDVTLALDVAEHMDDYVQHLPFAGEGASRQEHVEAYVNSRNHVIEAYLEDTYGVYDAHDTGDSRFEMYLGMNTDHIISTAEQAHQAVMDDDEAKALADGDKAVWEKLGSELGAHERQVEDIHARLLSEDHFPYSVSDSNDLGDEVSRFLTRHREDIRSARELGLTDEQIADGIAASVHGEAGFGPADSGLRLAEAARTEYEFAQIWQDSQGHAA